MNVLSLDLKCATPQYDHAMNTFEGSIDEHELAGVRASHVAYAACDVSPLCRALLRRPQYQVYLLSRSISVDCVRSTVPSRALARRRSMLMEMGLQGVPTLSQVGDGAL